jgi:mono/diheme cytochrome c family protein
MIETLRATLAVCILSAGSSPWAHAQRRLAVAHGQAIASEVCAGCHTGGSVVQGTAVPSFRAIAARPNLTAERLKDIITTPRHPMPATPLGTSEIEDLVAYIRSLR